MYQLTALIPHHDIAAVRRVLRQTAWDWTEQRVRGGRTGLRFWHLSLILPESDRYRAAALLRQTSPSRSVWYRPRHGWAIDSWLHPTPVTLQGAVIAGWPVDVDEALDAFTPIPPKESIGP